MTHTVTDLVDVAKMLLNEQIDGDIVLRYGETIRSSFKSVVIRCRVEGSTVGFRSVVIKHTLVIPDFPDSEIHNLLNDWATLLFLTSLSGDHPRPPILLAASLKDRILVMEDLGSGAPTTHDIVFSDDSLRAEEALLGDVRVLGRLHAATALRSHEYYKIRDKLGPTAPHLPLFEDPWSVAREQASIEQIDSAIASFRRCYLDAAGVAAPDVDHNVRTVIEEVEVNPGIFSAYCLGDQHIPDGFMVTNGDPRIFDFDCGGFRHGLLEGLPGRTTWGCMRRLPGDLVMDMDTAYQDELSKAGLAASNEHEFAKGKVHACARWFVFTVVHRLPEAIIKDRPRGVSTLRQQTMAYIKSFVGLPEAQECTPMLYKSAHVLLERLRVKWPDDCDDLPWYPAFKA